MLGEDKKGMEQILGKLSQQIQQINYRGRKIFNDATLMKALKDLRPIIEI